MPNQITPESVSEVLSKIETNSDRAVKSVEKQQTAISELQSTITELKSELNKAIARADAAERKTAEVIKSFSIRVENPSRHGFVKTVAEGRAFIQGLLECCKSNIPKGFPTREGFAGKADEIVDASNLTLEEFNPRLVRLTESFGAFRFCGKVPTRTGAQVIAVQTAYPDAKFVAKSTRPDTTTGTWDTKTIELRKIMALARIPMEDAADSLTADPNVAENIALDFARAIAKRIDYAFFNGNGTDDADNGNIDGIIKEGTVVTPVDNHDSFAEITYADILAVLNGVNSSVLQSPTCAWYIHPSLINTLFKGIMDGNGRPIFQDYSGAPFPNAEGFKNMMSILGYPVLPVSILPAVDGASKPYAVFGDLSAGFKYGLPWDFMFARSDEAGFQTGEIFFRGLARVGGTITDAKYIAVAKTHS